MLVSLSSELFLDSPGFHHLRFFCLTISGIRLLIHLVPVQWRETLPDLPQKKTHLLVHAQQRFGLWTG